MPSITTGSSVPAGTSPVMRSQAQSKILPHAVPGLSGVKASRSRSSNGDRLGRAHDLGAQRRDLRVHAAPDPPQPAELLRLIDGGPDQPDRGIEQTHPTLPGGVRLSNLMSGKLGYVTIRAHVRELLERPSARVLVIGGGINGIAVFRELAFNGVDVALVERSDFASGASAASSRMIHGGVRYLENGELRLVRESVQERNALLRLARHRVRPLETTIPIFSAFSGILSAPMRLLLHRSGRPVERGAVLIKVGLVLYDLFSRGARGADRLPRHRFRGRRRSLRELPQLNPRVRFTATYHDASLPEPERLAIDLLLDGLDANPLARAVNYVTAVSAGEGGVRLRDEETGEEFDFAADFVVNVSGPWTDLTNRALGVPTELLGGTKGSHIVLDSPELLDALGGREIFFEYSDGRIVLIYPVNGRVLVGTTDIEADPAEPAVCTDAEVAYFFDLIAHVFPTVPVGREQIVFRYAGIRPLPNHGDLRPGFVSRDYRLVDTPLADGSAAGDQSRRGQVDDVPRAGRAPRGRGDAAPRDRADGRPLRRADRRRTRVPG